MAAPGFMLFETAIGRCAIAWGERGIVGVQLPEECDHETRARIHGRFPGAREAKPPLAVEQAVKGIAALLRGEPSDLSKVELDLDRIPSFHRQVYAITRAIRPGATLSYGAVAARLGVPTQARAVGQALARNPFPIIVPCHRVVAAGGKIGGFSASGGSATKRRLLAIESAERCCLTHP